MHGFPAAVVLESFEHGIAMPEPVHVAGRQVRAEGIVGGEGVPVGQVEEIRPDALDIAVRFDGGRSPGEHRRWCGGLVAADGAAHGIGGDQAGQGDEVMPGQTPARIVAVEVKEKGIDRLHVEARQLAGDLGELRVGLLAEHGRAVVVGTGTKIAGQRLGAGALAAERARRVLRELEAAEEQIEAAVSGLAGCFRISAHPVWMQAVLPAAIARLHDSFPGIELKLRAFARPQGIRLLTEGASDLHCGGIDAGQPLPPFLRRDSFVEVEAGIVARKGHPLHARRAGLQDLAGWPWVDYDGAAPADGDAGDRPSLFGVLHDLYQRTGRRAGTVIRADFAGPFPMASGPYLAWLPLKFLHAFDRDLRPLPVSFGRHR